MIPRTVVRPALGLAVAAMGVVDLASALLSRPPERLVALRHLVPTDVLDTSRTFTLLAGVLLIVTALGLARGKRVAFVAALFLCAVSVPVNLLKAFDFEEATVAAALMFVLGVSGESFRVKSREPSWRALRSPALALLVFVVVYAVAGCWIVEQRFGPAEPSIGRAVAEAAYQMFGVGTPMLVAPREHHVVRWFLGSIPVLGITLLAGLALAALRPAAHRGRHRAEAERVRALLREHGDSSVAAFALDEDVDYFFSRNERAVIAYRFENGVLLVIGDPIGPADEMPSLLDDFEQFCREHDWTFGFYQARPERLAPYHARGWRAVHVGEDPVLHPPTFTLDGPARASLRRNVRKVERSGVEVRHWVPGDDAFDAQHDTDGVLAQLREISAAWLRGKTGGEKGFCMGRFDPHELPNVWLAVAWNPESRRVEAFCTWTPIWARRGWAIDLMRRRDDARPGVTEFLAVRCIEHARERGDAVMSLSLSALAKVTVAGGAEAPEAAAEDPARQFLIERLGRFYDFQGLFRWKRKFGPTFEDRYLVYPDPLALPRIALALIRAQSPGGLMAYLRPAAGGGESAAPADSETAA